MSVPLPLHTYDLEVRFLTFDARQLKLARLQSGAEKSPLIAMSSPPVP